jgi:hypothetical protein
MEYWVRFPAAPLIFAIALGKLERCLAIAQQCRAMPVG